jgi:hypothetical protein
LTHPADPPTPIPNHLWPQRAPLGPGDLRIAPSTEELRMIARVLDEEKLAGQTLVTMRDGSPWLEVDVAVPHHVVPADLPPDVPLAQCPACGLELPVDDSRAQIAHMEAEHPDLIQERLRAAGLEPARLRKRPGIHRYAIWRYTCAAYRIGRDGAVDDDPFLRP